MCWVRWQQCLVLCSSAQFNPVAWPQFSSLFAVRHLMLRACGNTVKPPSEKCFVKERDMLKTPKLVSWWFRIKTSKFLCEREWGFSTVFATANETKNPVLVLAGLDIIFFLVAGIVLRIGLRIRIMLITQWCFSKPQHIGKREWEHWEEIPARWIIAGRCFFPEN